jgi:hypothetical protein
VQIENNLAVVHYELNRLATQEPIERCPTGAIVWFDPNKQQPVKGIDAKKITRKSPLPVELADIPMAPSVTGPVAANSGVKKS